LKSGESINITTEGYVLYGDILFETNSKEKNPPFCYGFIPGDHPCQNLIPNEKLIRDLFFQGNYTQLKNVSFPDFWMKEEGNTQKGVGGAIYIFPLKGDPEILYTLNTKLSFTNGSFRIWRFSQGRFQLLDSDGVVTLNPSIHSSSWKRMNAVSRFDENDLLIIELTNFEFFNGQIRSFSITSGSENFSELNSGFIIDVFILGAIFLSGIYHLILFSFRMTQRDTLWLSLFCFAVALRLFATSSIYHSILYDTYGLLVHHKLLFISFLLSYTSFINYYNHLLNRYLNQRFVSILNVHSIIMFFIMVFCKNSLFDEYLLFFLSGLMFAIPVIFYTLLKCSFFETERIKDRRTARKLILLIVILIVAAIFDTMRLILKVDPFKTDIIGFAMFIFILGQSWMIAENNSESWKASERLALRLEKEIQEKTNLQSSTEDLILQKEKIDQDLKDATSQLIQAEKLSSLGAMVAGISHEISNPVNFIETSRFSLEEEIQEMKKYLFSMIPDTEEAKTFRVSLEKKFQSMEEGMGNISIGVKRVTEINKSMRNAARSDEFVTTGVDLTEVLAEAITILGSKLKSYQVEKYLQDRLPTVNVKRSHIGQVFMNILSNAGDALNEISAHNPGFQGKIRISIVYQEPNITISFEDNGPGIPQEKKSKVMNAFYTTKPPGVGTGLGLAICGKIIDDHKGKIQIEDSEWGGAKFILTIPV
jgi:signal transduction histidine kinase